MHKNADVDALASAYYLSEFYGDAVVISDGLDKHAKRLVREFNIPVLSDIPLEYDEVITVDTASREQLGKFSDVEIDVVFDHHESNNIMAKKRVVDTTYPSCAEMIYDMYPFEASRKAALLILAGIIGDTLWFKHANMRTLRIFHDIMEKYGIEMDEVRGLFDDAISFGEKIAVLKGFQRLVYRTYGDKIVIATRVSANESLVANELLDFADIVFVGSSRKNEVRIIGRSREINLLDIFSRLAEDYGCTYGGHRKAAGVSCQGDIEALLNSLFFIASEYFKG